ncbi:hypothetical protein ACHAXS_005782 [Conticribra weissflogii]
MHEGFLSIPHIASGLNILVEYGDEEAELVLNTKSKPIELEISECGVEPRHIRLAKSPCPIAQKDL